MARIRSIKPIFWDDELVGAMPAMTRLTFIGLFSLADDEGRLPGRAVGVRNKLFMYDEDVTTSDVEDALWRLHNARRIRLYGSASQRYIEVVNFRAHQVVSKPQKSQYPAPSRHYPSLPVDSTHLQGESGIEDAESGREQVESPRPGLHDSGAIQEVGDMQAIPLPLHDQSPTSDVGNGEEGRGMEGTNVPLSTSDKPKRDLNAEAREVFDHWCKVWNKRTTTMFDGKRKSATVARLRSGYTVSQLCESISGYRYSEHHNGSNGKPYNDLELFMRDAVKVDAGIAYGSAAANADGAGVSRESAALLASLGYSESGAA